MTDLKFIIWNFKNGGMKDKLLITLGCSYTEGHGCYDFSIFPIDKNIYDGGIDVNILNYQKNKLKPGSMNIFFNHTYVELRKNDRPLMETAVFSFVL